MKLFGVDVGKEKPLEFPAFRDMVRLAVRRQHANATVVNNDTGFSLTIDGKQNVCNLRSLYMEYKKSPKDKDAIIQRWIGSLVVEIPEHGWIDAQITLRPTVKHINDFIAVANNTMQRANPPDSLPFMPFIGDLGVIVMRDLPGTAVAVTQATLDAWGVTFEEAMKAAIMNMNMLPFPIVSTAMHPPGAGKKTDLEEVGLVFEGDHLTATWLVIERFRDFVSQRLEGDFVAFVPIRSRLVAIRADEHGLITQVQQSNRNFSLQTYSLTLQAYHISAVTLGGVVTVHQVGLGNERVTLDKSSMFARGTSTQLPTPGLQPAAEARQGPVDLSAWGGLVEPTGPDSGSKVRTPYDQPARR